MTLRAAVIGVAVFLMVPTSAGAKFFAGAVPDLASRPHSHHSVLAHAANLDYNGGPVLHWNRTHLIFWQPSGSGLSFDAGYEPAIERFLADVAADSRKPTNVYGLSGQYHDTIGPAAYDSTYGGAVVATDPLPPNGCIEPPPPPLGTGPGWHYCLSDQQLEDEVVHVIRTMNLPVTLHDIYFLVMPNGLGSCEFSGPSNCALGGSDSGSYCGYHSSSVDGEPYAVIPYNAVPRHCMSDNPRPNASTADPAISTISHEHNEVVTDPLDDAWIAPSLQEDGDLCASSFGPSLGGPGVGAWNQVIHGHHYYLQEEWSNEDGSCQPRDESDRISLSANPVASGARRVKFTGHGRDPDGSITAYNWFFGDHRTAHHRVTTHTFKHAGTYRVILRTTDRSGNWAFYARRIRVGKR
jgi:hypothetical protein